jgi:hypothetical protein
MTGRLGWRALLPAAALALGIGSGSVPGGAASIGTPENTQFLPVWLGPGSDALHFGAPALLNLPPGWSQGDAGVVVAPGGAWAPGARDRLVAGLLDAGAAVLELNRPREGLPGEDPLRRDLAEALATLHAGFGAGLVVLLGEGEGGRGGAGGRRRRRRAGPRPSCRGDPARPRARLPRRPGLAGGGLAGPRAAALRGAGRRAAG